MIRFLKDRQQSSEKTQKNPFRCHQPTRLGFSSAGSAPRSVRVEETTTGASAAAGAAGLRREARGFGASAAGSASAAEASSAAGASFAATATSATGASAGVA